MGVKGQEKGRKEPDVQGLEYGGTGITKDRTRSWGRRISNLCSKGQSLGEVEAKRFHIYTVN